MVIVASQVNWIATGWFGSISGTMNTLFRLLDELRSKLPGVVGRTVSACWRGLGRIDGVAAGGSPEGVGGVGDARGGTVAAGAAGDSDSESDSTGDSEGDCESDGVSLANGDGEAESESVANGLGCGDSL